MCAGRGGTAGGLQRPPFFQFKSIQISSCCRQQQMAAEQGRPQPLKKAPQGAACGAVMRSTLLYCSPSNACSCAAATSGAPRTSPNTSVTDDSTSRQKGCCVATKRVPTSLSNMISRGLAAPRAVMTARCKRSGRQTTDAYIYGRVSSEGATVWWCWCDLCIRACVCVYDYHHNHHHYHHHQQQQHMRHLQSITWMRLPARPPASQHHDDAGA